MLVLLLKPSCWYNDRSNAIIGDWDSTWVMPRFSCRWIDVYSYSDSSNSPVLSINGTFNETYFDEREWEYRDDTTGDVNLYPSSVTVHYERSCGRIYNVTKDSVQEPYASGGQFEDEIPNPCDTLIRYKLTLGHRGL